MFIKKRFAGKYFVKALLIDSALLCLAPVERSRKASGANSASCGMSRSLMPQDGGMDGGAQRLRPKGEPQEGRVNTVRVHFLRKKGRFPCLRHEIFYLGTAPGAISLCNCL